MIINAVRSLMQGGTDVVGIGHTTGYWVVLSLVWCAGIVAGVRHPRRPPLRQDPLTRPDPDHPDRHTTAPSNWRSSGRSATRIARSSSPGRAVSRGRGR